MTRNQRKPNSSTKILSLSLYLLSLSVSLTLSLSFLSFSDSLTLFSLSLSLFLSLILSLALSLSHSRSQSFSLSLSHTHWYQLCQATTVPNNDQTTATLLLYSLTVTRVYLRSQSKLQLYLPHKNCSGENILIQDWKQNLLKEPLWHNALDKSLTKMKLRSLSKTLQIRKPLSKSLRTQKRQT